MGTWSAEPDGNKQELEGPGIPGPGAPASISGLLFSNDGALNLLGP